MDALTDYGLMWSNRIRRMLIILAETLSSGIEIFLREARRRCVQMRVVTNVHCGPCQAYWGLCLWNPTDAVLASLPSEDTPEVW